MTFCMCMAHNHNLPVIEGQGQRSEVKTRSVQPRVRAVLFEFFCGFVDFMQRGIYIELLMAHLKATFLSTKAIYMKYPVFSAAILNSLLAALLVA